MRTADEVKLIAINKLRMVGNAMLLKETVTGKSVTCDLEDAKRLLVIHDLLDESGTEFTLAEIEDLYFKVLSTGKCIIEEEYNWNSTFPVTIGGEIVLGVQEPIVYTYTNVETTGVGYQPTPVEIIKNVGHDIRVHVDGYALPVGDGQKDPYVVYFSGDGGTTARNYNEIVIGDLMYYNASNQIAGAHLDEDDQIFIYIS